MGLTRSQMRKRQALSGLAIGAGCWLLFSAAYLLGLFDSFDLRLLDLRFRIRGERPSGQIALVGVDDATIRGYGAWPLPRDSYALLISALEQGGARAIGFDLQFPEDRNQSPTANQLLARMSAAHGNLVHSIWFYAQPADSAASLTPAEGDALSRHGTIASDTRVAVAAGAAIPYEQLTVAAKRFGHITVTVDHDGGIRRVPLFVRYGERVYPSLALAVFSAEQGLSSVPSPQEVPGGVRIRWGNGRQTFAPVDRQGSTGIDFAGDLASFPGSCSMLDVLQWYRAGDTERLREAFAGKTVLVGLTSREEASEDVGPTPFAAATPLLLVHANLIENLHRGRFLSRPPYAGYLGILLVCACALGLLLSTLPLPVSAGLIVATTVAAGALSQMALSWGRMDIPPVLPLALGPALYAVTASYRYVFLESRSRRREQEIQEGLTVQQQFLPEALIGKRLAGYRIVERLGAGGMGVVYRGVDEGTGRDVAVKVLPGGLLADERSRRRFRREALALSRLRHPWIAGLITWDSQDGHEFIVMEFVHGESLATRIRRSRLPEAEVIEIGAQICEALAEAHGHGVLHRDLKPGNVMIGRAGEVKLLDFGLARLRSPETSATVLLSTQITEPGHVVGTLAYLAPETLQGHAADERTDVYGVGMILFEMSTGRRPYRDESPHELMYMIANQPPPTPSVLNGNITPALETIILNCLAKSPTDRPAGAAEVLKYLRNRAPLVAR